MTPQRIQRQRTRGWKMPANTIYVGRSSAQNGYGTFGNPFECVCGSHCAKSAGDDESDYCCVEAFREYVLSGIEKRVARTGTLKGFVLAEGDKYRHRDNLVAKLPALAGKNLACWCPLDKPCHADVLLELANAQEPPR